VGRRLTRGGRGRSRESRSEGRIRYHLFGEGDYEESEQFIQQLLAEAGVDARGAEVAADWDHLGSGETYVGF